MKTYKLLKYLFLSFTVILVTIPTGCSTQNKNLQKFDKDNFPNIINYDYENIELNIDSVVEEISSEEIGHNLSDHVFTEGNIDNTDKKLVEPNYLTAEEEKIKEKNFKYTFKDDLLRVEIDLLSHKILYEFLPNGVNKIMGIETLGFWINEVPYHTTTRTDYIGPYIVADLSASRPPSKFTGGWHGGDGGATGAPTGKTISYNIYIDGEDISKKGTSGEFQEVLLRVVNEINSYNTNEKVIQETVEYRITKQGIAVKITIKALKDILIERYYGIQL